MLQGPEKITKPEMCQGRAISGFVQWKCSRTDTMIIYDHLTKHSQFLLKCRAKFLLSIYGTTRDHPNISHGLKPHQPTGIKKSSPTPGDPPWRHRGTATFSTRLVTLAASAMPEGSQNPSKLQWTSIIYQHGWGKMVTIPRMVPIDFDPQPYLKKDLL